MEASREFKDVPVYSGDKAYQAEPIGGNLVPVAPGLPMMQTKTSYHTAVTVQRPRDLDKVVAAVKREAALAGEAFYWSWPVKDKGKTVTLSGPSIGLAMCVAREWTNVAVPVDYQETATHDIFTAHFVDLERGFTVSRIWKQSKGANKDLSKWGERAVNMTFQAAQSRAIRNAVLAGVPKWLVDQAKVIAMDAVLKGITPEKIAEARATILKTMKELGVDEARLVAAIGVPMAQWAPDEIIALKGMRTQIRDGQASAEELFPQVEEKAGPAKNGPPADKKKTEPADKKTAGPVHGITEPTMASIEIEAKEKGLDLNKLLAGVPVGELTEEDGQAALTAIRNLTGKEPEGPEGDGAPPAAGEDENAFGW
jgi:hypothetical protein